MSFFSLGYPKQAVGRHKEGKRLNWSTVGSFTRQTHYKATRVRRLKSTRDKVAKITEGEGNNSGGALSTDRWGNR